MLSTLVTMIYEMSIAILGKVAWKAVFERFYTRLVLYALNKLKEMNTNDVIDDTIQDIINSLKGKRLKVIDGEIH